MSICSRSQMFAGKLTCFCCQHTQAINETGRRSAPPLTRTNFDGRSPQLDGQILTENVENHKNKRLAFGEYVGYRAMSRQKDFLLKDSLLKYRSHFKAESFKRGSCVGWNRGEEGNTRYNLCKVKWPYTSERKGGGGAVCKKSDTNPIKNTYRSSV
jgi:hypothetical protein